MSANKRGSGIDYYINSPLFNNGSSNFSRSTGADRERMIVRNLERNISELALNRFKWTGLPKSIDPRFIEMCLLFSGSAVWYWDDTFDSLIVARGTGAGAVNFMDNPVSFTVIGPSAIVTGNLKEVGFTPKQLSAYLPTSQSEKPKEELRRKAVGMWPNFLRIPELDTIAIYSTRIGNTDRTLEINTKNARHTKILSGSANMQLSIENLNRQIDEGVEAVKISGAMNPADTIQALDLGIDPLQFEKLSLLRTRWWNECMGLLGIDNSNQDKKERLVAAEVSANDTQTDSFRFNALNARRNAIEQINFIFDTNIEVDFNVEVEQQAKQAALANGINPNKDGE